MNDFKIKALSPDNDAAVRGLIRLFTHVYGDTYPLKGVYRGDFWKAQLGRRFVSIVAEDRGDIVAHIAVYRRSEAPYDTIITLPVTDPAYRHTASRLYEAAESMVRRLAKAQGWRTAMSLVYEDVAAMQAISDSIVHSREVAILPGYLPASPVRARGIRIAKCVRENGGLRRSALVTTRIYGADRLPECSIYVPERHREICRLLLAPFGLKRRMPAASPRTGAPQSHSTAPIERSYHRGLGTYHLFITPSGVDASTPLEPKSWDGRKAIFATVDLTDAAAPEFCDHLENQGYRFCGIVPQLRGRDGIVYFKETEAYVDRQPFQSPRARMLSHYMERYDISRALDILVPTDCCIAAEPSRRGAGPSPEARV